MYQMQVSSGTVMTVGIFQLYFFLLYKIVTNNLQYTLQNTGHGLVNVYNNYTNV